MREFSYTFMVFFAFLGCSSKYGQHELEYMDGQRIPSDEVYVQFLIEQIDQHPKKAQNYIKLADIYTSENKNSEALDVLEKGKRALPNDIDVLVGLSNIYLQQKNIEPLSNLLNRIKNIDSNNVGFLKLSSGYALLQHDYANALFFANRAILINPYDDENLYLRGEAQLLHRDSVTALISFEEAMDLNNIYRNFSMAFDVAIALNDPEKAKNYLDEFVAKNPTKDPCYEWGTYYNNIGATDTSKMILLKCLEKNTNEPRINFELAKNYNRRSNSSDSAIYYIDKFIAGSKEPLAGYVLKAKILDKDKNYAEAIKVYDAALEIDSTFLPAQQGLKKLEGKVAYLRVVRRKASVRQETEALKPLKTKEID